MILARQPGYTAQELDDGEVAVLSPDGNRVIMLNAMGGVIWDLCDGARSLEAVINIICKSTTGPLRNSIEQDVHAFVREMNDMGLMRSIDAMDS